MRQREAMAILEDRAKQNQRATSVRDEYHDSEACPNCKVCSNCDGIEQAEGCTDHDAVDCGAVDSQQHTPLPWIVNEFDPCSIESPSAAVGHRVIGVTYGDDSEATANAALIVRAVNGYAGLAEALRELLTASEILDGQEAPPDDDDV